MLHLEIYVICHRHEWYSNIRVCFNTQTFPSEMVKHPRFYLIFAKKKSKTKTTPALLSVLPSRACSHWSGRSVRPTWALISMWMNNNLWLVHLNLTHVLSCVCIQNCLEINHTTSQSQFFLSSPSIPCKYYFGISFFSFCDMYACRALMKRKTRLNVEELITTSISKIMHKGAKVTKQKDLR